MVEAVLLDQARERHGPRQMQQFARHRADAAARIPPDARAVSPCQKGILPGSPGAGETSTRSCVISSMRQVQAPRMMVSPVRLSKTISSSSSPTRAPRFRAGKEHAVKPAVGNGAAVDDGDRCARPRAR